MRGVMILFYFILIRKVTIGIDQKGQNLRGRWPINPFSSWSRILLTRARNQSKNVLESVRNEKYYTSEYCVFDLSGQRGGELDRGADHPIDAVGKSFALFLGSLVAIQSLGTLLSARDNHLWGQVGKALVGEDTAEAIQKIRKILDSFDDHGVVDVFAKYRQQDVWMSVYALGRLQHASKWYQSRNQSLPEVEDAELLEDLAHYAVYANAVYGWTMELAFGGRLNLGGDLATVLRRTSIPEDDVIATNWESRAHRPVYFLVRDTSKKSIVLCIRGTWSAHDVLTDLCCTSDDLELHPTLRSKYFFPHFGKKVRAHHGMLEAARALQDDLEDLLVKVFESHPDYTLVLAGHSMGGGVAAILGLLWDSAFPTVQVYLYGPPCVIHKESGRRDRLKTRIVSVVGEDDPFCRLSLGHVGDLSSSVAHLCEDERLRKEVIVRTVNNVKEMSVSDLEWCSKTLKHLRNQMRAEKLYPPGRTLLLTPTDRKQSQFRLLELSSDFFEDLFIRPRMFDLTRHVPVKYIRGLRWLADKAAT